MACGDPCSSTGGLAAIYNAALRQAMLEVVDFKADYSVEGQSVQNAQKLGRLLDAVKLLRDELARCPAEVSTAVRAI